MTAPVYIGDEWTAAGYRLAGARTRVPEPGGVRRILTDVLADARDNGTPVVLIGAAVARELEPAELESVQAAMDPPVLVVSDAAARTVPKDPGMDLIARIRRRMGVAE